MKWFRLSLYLLIVFSAVGFAATTGNADTNGNGDPAYSCTCDANADDPPTDPPAPSPDPTQDLCEALP